MTSATRSAARVLNAVTLHSRPRKASHNTTARRSVQMFSVFSCVNTYQNMLCQPSEHKEFDRGSEEDRVVEITPMMKSGGRKKKKARNRWESSASELEKDECQEKRAWVKRFVWRCQMIC